MSENTPTEPGFESFDGPLTQDELDAATREALAVAGDAESDLAVQGVLPPLFVAEYVETDDLEATLLVHRPEEERELTDAAKVPGWFFQVTANESVLSETGEISFGDDVEYVTVFNGAVEADLPTAVAQVIAALIEQVGPRATEFLAHAISGSVQEFDARFQGAFDLRTGAPELL